MNSAKLRQAQDAARLAANVGSPLADFFSAAKDKQIFLAVLRNYEELPGKPGRDIDIFVDQASQSLAADIVRVSFGGQGWSIISDWTRSHVRSISMTKRAGDEAAGFTIDLVSRIQWLGIDIVLPETIKKITISETPYPHVSPGGDAALRFQKLLLRGEAETFAKQDLLRSLLALDPRGFDTVMSDILDATGLATIKSALLSGRELNEFSDLFKRTRGTLLRKRLLKNPFLPLKWAKLALNLSIVPPGRRGKVIAFVGPDGSGKSTMIERAKALLDNHGPRKTWKYYGRVPIFPRIATLIPKKRRTPVADFTKRHSGSSVSPHTRFRMAIYFLYYGVEGFFARIVLKAHKLRGGVVLFDRYAYDFAVQPAYSKLPKMWLDVLLFVLPKPDIVCFVHSDPEVIYARKPELRLEDIRQQQERFRQLFDRFGRKPKVFECDTSNFASDDFVELVQIIAADWDGWQPSALKR